MNFIKTWADAPKDLRLGLIGVALIFSFSSAIAIGKSDKVEVDSNGFTISNQAIACFIFAVFHLEKEIFYGLLLQKSWMLPE